MRPLGTNVIVDPLYDPPTVETGLSPGAPALFMPDSGKNPMSQQGLVVSVGEEQEAIYPGDHILYHPFIQCPFRMNGHEYLMVAARHIVGRLSVKGELIALPHDVVVKPDFAPAGRPVQKGSLWVPSQVFDTDIPCTGQVVRIGCMVTEVSIGQRILFPPEAGNEIGLRQVWYVIPEKEILATLETEVKVEVMVTPATWSSHGHDSNLQ